MTAPTPTTAPRRRLRRKDRERLMLHAAGEAFAAQGFHRASMEPIATAAGITKPMLYRYFGSKEGLYAAYVRASGRELVDSVRAPETRGEAPEVRLRAGIRAFLGYVDAHRPGWPVHNGEPTPPTDAHMPRTVTR